MLAALVLRLMTARFFEDAATIVLKAMLTYADATLASGKYTWATAGSRAALPPAGAAGRLLRGMVHLRPGAGYQHLIGIEYPGGEPVDGVGYLTSANVWRLLVEHRCSVSIDVRISSIHPWLRDDAGARDKNHEPDSHLDLDPAESAGSVPSEATRERMLGRDATHVHVVPLRRPDGEIEGMIALEASCQAATGDDVLWQQACHSLEQLAGVAAPYLAALPPRPAAPAASPDPFLPVVGPTTARLLELLRIFARQDETVLISGPTGSGKSRLARWCHENSSRRERPFETLDLLSVPEQLQMAELFGWKRGAFTGAVKDSLGAVARAGQGTLFIDEIDKLSLKAQAGLLRVLEERRYRPIGDEAGERTTSVRFVIGTNADLRAAVRSGRFREDLYYRIHVLPVRLPPLSERLDELPAWAEYMLARRHAETGSKGAAWLAPEASRQLTAMAWPGNLRQLDNIIRCAYALALADCGASNLLIESSHLTRALEYEEPAETSSLSTQLWRTARAFVEEAKRRSSAGGTLSLDACEVLRGLVLSAAVLRSGNREDAFILLGQQQLLKNRNHHRALRRELHRVRDLLAVIGGEIDPELAALLHAAAEAPEAR